MDSSDAESVDMPPTPPPVRRVNNTDHTPLPELPPAGSGRGFLWLNTVVFTDNIVAAAGEYARSKPVKPRGIKKEAVWRTVRLMGGGIDHFNSKNHRPERSGGFENILDLFRMRGILTDDLKDEIEDLCDEITTKITSQPSYDSSQTSTTLSQQTQSKSQQDHTQLPPTVHRGFQSDILPPHQYQYLYMG